jgi:hypothetical protein
MYQCTLYARVTCECTSRILKNLAMKFQYYSELYLAVPPHTLQAAPREGWPGDSDLWLCHLPVDLRS